MNSAAILSYSLVRRARSYLAQTEAPLRLRVGAAEIPGLISKLFAVPASAAWQPTWHALSGYDLIAHDDRRVAHTVSIGVMLRQALACSRRMRRSWLRTSLDLPDWRQHQMVPG